MCMFIFFVFFFFFSSRRRHTRWNCDWSSDVCSSDLFQPWAAEKVKQMGRGPAAGALSKMTKEQQLAAIDTEIARLERECMPHGVPGITLVGAMHGMQMVTAPGTLVQLTELNHDWRVVSIDGRAHSKEPDPKFNGESVARWDGDTLVIDTIG